MDDSRIERLMQDLRRGEMEVGWSAVRRLVKIGKPAVPALCEALRDKDCSARCRAVVALGWIGATSAVPSVCEALKDGDGRSEGCHGETNSKKWAQQGAEEDPKEAFKS